MRHTCIQSSLVSLFGLSFSSHSVAGRVVPHAVPHRCCGKIGLSTSPESFCYFRLATFAPTSAVILCCHIVAPRFLSPVGLEWFRQWNYSRLPTELPASAVILSRTSLTMLLYIIYLFIYEKGFCETIFLMLDLSWSCLEYIHIIRIGSQITHFEKECRCCFVMYDN